MSKPGFSTDLSELTYEYDAFSAIFKRFGIRRAVSECLLSIFGNSLIDDLFNFW